MQVSDMLSHCSLDQFLWHDFSAHVLVAQRPATMHDLVLSDGTLGFANVRQWAARQQRMGSDWCKGSSRWHCETERMPGTPQGSGRWASCRCAAAAPPESQAARCATVGRQAAGSARLRAQTTAPSGCTAARHSTVCHRSSSAHSSRQHRLLSGAAHTRSAAPSYSLQASVPK